MAQLTSSGLPKRKVTCVQGDPTCEFGSDSSSCTFHAKLCINSADPRFPTCHATDVAVFEVLKPNLTSVDAADQLNRDTLEQDAGGGTGHFGVTVVRRGNTIYAGTPNATSNLCSDTVDIEVPLRASAGGGFGPGSRTLRVKTLSTAGKPAAVSVRLQCQPHL
jgi:hypothetical protein